MLLPHVQVGSCSFCGVATRFFRDRDRLNAEACSVRNQQINRNRPNRENLSICGVRSTSFTSMRIPSLSSNYRTDVSYTCHRPSFIETLCLYLCVHVLARRLWNHLLPQLSGT